MEGSGSGARRSDESDGASRSRGRLARIGPHSPLTRRDWALPAQPSALIGRAGQLAASQRLLVRADVRLLTLTGPAGVGKTRLAVALAERVGAHFPDGVGFVDLTPIGDQRQVVPTISRALGAPPPAGRTSLQALQDFLERRTVLVVLDNFEHVLDAAPHLAEILTACPRLTLVVTSRAALHLRWEHVLPVPPLALPDTRHLASPASLVRKASVALFVDRARAVAPCNGSGNLVSSLRLPAGGSVTYTVQATVPAGTALGTQIAATAAITPPAGVADPNAANNGATDTDTVTAPACSPRPRVAVQVAPAGAGRLQVTLTPSTNPGQAPNQIQAVLLGTLQNAAADVPVQPGVPAAQNGLGSGAQVALSGPVASLNLVVRRVPPPGITTPVAFTAPMTVTDGCGAWPTFAGGGTGVP